VSDAIEELFSNTLQPGEDPVLSNYFNGETQNIERNPVEDLFQTAPKPKYDPYNYKDPELSKFMHTPFVDNRVKTAESKEEEQAKIASTFLMMKKFNLPYGEIYNNYDKYARHFTGDTEPVKAWQRIKDSYELGKIQTEMEMLTSRYLKSPYSPEAEKKYEAELGLLQSKLPPNYEESNILMKMATGATEQIYRQLYAANYILGADNIMMRLEESGNVTDEGVKLEFKPMVQGLVDWITGNSPYGKEKVPRSILALAGLAASRISPMIGGKIASTAVGLTAGVTLPEVKYYAATEEAETYMQLSSIKAADTVDDEGNIVPGKKLDEETKRVLSKYAGLAKGLVEAYFEKYFLGKIPGVKKLFGDPEVVLSMMSQKALKRGVSRALVDFARVGLSGEMSEITQEITQTATDEVAQNLAIILDQNKEYFKDDMIGFDQVKKEMYQTVVQTFWATAPMAFFGGGFTALSNHVKVNKAISDDVEKIVRDNTEKVLKEEGEFAAEKVQEYVQKDPRMEKYSDKTIEKTKGQVIKQGELMQDLQRQSKVTDELVKEYIDQKLYEAFVAENPDMDTKSEAFQTDLNAYKEKHIGDFIAPLNMSEPALYQRYKTFEDFVFNNYNVIDKKKYTDEKGVERTEYTYELNPEGDTAVLSFEKYKENARNLNNYIENWNTAPDSKKYLANMKPVVSTLNRVLDSVDVDQKTKDILQENIKKVSDLVEQAQGGSKVQTLADYNIRSEIEIDQLNKEIERLQSLGTKYKKDKAALAQIGEQIREVIKAKYELQSDVLNINHIVDAVSRNNFNEQRLRLKLEDVYTRLNNKIEEFESPEMQSFLNGDLESEQLVKKFMEIVDESIQEVEDQETLYYLSEAKQEMLDEIEKAKAENKSPEEILNNIPGIKKGTAGSKLINPEEKAQVKNDIKEELTSAIDEIKEANQKERLRLDKLFSQNIKSVPPGVNRTAIMLLELRANKKGLSLKELMDLIGFEDDVFLRGEAYDNLIQELEDRKKNRDPELYGRVSSYTGKDGKNHVALWFSDNATPFTVIHELGHLFEITLSPEEHNQITPWINESTIKRLQNYVTEYDKRIRILEKKFRETKDKEYSDKLYFEKKAHDKYAYNLMLQKQWKPGDKWTYSMGETFAHAFQERVMGETQYESWLNKIFDMFRKFMEALFDREDSGLTLKLPKEISEYFDSLLSKDISETTDKGKTQKFGDSNQIGGLYHGSSRIFDEFSPEYMSTGAGGQFFSEGYYFTSQKDIAKKYAVGASQTNKTDTKIVYSIILHHGKNPSQYDYAEWHEPIKNYQLEKIMKEVAIEMEDREFEFLEDKDLSDILSNVGISKDDKYYADIDAIIRRTTLTRAKEKFLQLVKDYESLRGPEERTPEYTKAFDDLIANYGPEARLIPSDITYKDLYKQFTEHFANTKDASLFMLRAGIDGVKYPADTTMGNRSYKKGTNYVVYDDKAITISETENLDLVKPSTQINEIEVLAEVEKTKTRMKAIYKIENFKKMLISKMRKSLYNYLELEGNKLMTSILRPVETTVSYPAAEFIKTWQKVISMANGVVSESDIEEVKNYINSVIQVGKNPEVAVPSGFVANYNQTAEEIADILLNNMKISYNEEMKAVAPKLSIEDLFKIKTDLDVMRYIGKVELAEKTKNRLIDDEILKSEFLLYQDKVAKKSKKDGSIIKGLKFEAMMPYHWAKKLFGEFGVEFLWTQRLDNANKAKIAMKERADKITAEIGMEKKKIAEKMHETRMVNGEEYSLQQLMYYWLVKIGEDNDAKTHLVYGNEVDEKMFTTDILDTVLTKEEKKMAQVFQGDLQEAWHGIAATYEKMNQKRLGRVSFYLPLQAINVEYDTLDEDIFRTMIRGTDYKKQGVSKDFTLKREEATPDKAHEINDGLWDVWQNYIFKQEEYNAHAEWVSRAKHFMNDKTIRATIQENYDKSWVKGLDKYIEDVANPSSLHGSSFIDRSARFIRHNMAVAALAARPAIWLRQIPSVMMFMSEAGPGTFMSTIGKFNSSWYVDGKKAKNKIIDFITEVDPYSIQSGTGYEDMLGYRYQKNKILKTKKQIDDFGMKGISVFDNIMKAIGWYSIYSKNKSLVGEEKAIQMARDYVALTQPSSDKGTLPSLYRHSELMSMALMFTQQPTKIYNYLIYQTLPNLNPLNSEAEHLAGVYGLAAIMTMNAAIWMLSHKQVPEDPEDFAAALLAGSVSAIPIIGKEIISQSEGTHYDSGVFTAPVRGVFNMFSAKKWDKAMNSNEEMAKQIKSFSNALGIAGWYSAVTNDWIDFSVTGKPIHVILGGDRREDK